MSEDKLSAKEEIFVQEYLLDFNATQAAMRAGYTDKPENARSQGYFLLTKAHVSRAVRAGIQERVDALKIDANDILLRALKVYERSMQGEPVLKWNPDTMSMEHSGEWMFDSKGATKALELIGKLLGAFMKPDKDGDKQPFNIIINTQPGQRGMTIENQPEKGLPMINTKVKE